MALYQSGIKPVGKPHTRYEEDGEAERESKLVYWIQAKLGREYAELCLEKWREGGNYPDVLSGSIRLNRLNKADLPFVRTPDEPIPSTANLQYKRWTYKELYEAVYHVTIALKKNGFEPGMRVAAYTSNCTEALIACLATTALGGIWSSAASDFGPEGVKERFEQVKPSFIVGVDAVV